MNSIQSCDAQIENEYGFCGFNDKAYLQHLVDTARASLGDEAVLFTTDPPNVVTMGGLYGDDVISCALVILQTQYSIPCTQSTGQPKTAALMNAGALCVPGDGLLIAGTETP